VERALALVALCNGMKAPAGPSQENVQLDAQEEAPPAVHLPVDTDTRQPVHAAALGAARDDVQPNAREPAPAAQVPRATYRLQLHADFTLADAIRAVPTLARLGISHLYLSPLLHARPGSRHGYDVVDPTRLNPELGDETDLDALVAALRDRGMGILLDIVPNHMAVIEADNPWWFDVLENGPAAEHAPFFDIEWAPLQRELHGKVLLPVLGQGYGAVLEAGEIVPHFDPVRLGVVLHYHGHRFPIDPADIGAVLRALPLPPQAGVADLALLQQLALDCERLPPRDDARRHTERRDQVRAIREALRSLLERAPWAAQWLQDCVRQLQGDVGDPASFDALDTLLQRQAWRLAHWRTAGDEINYRRFFDIDALAALRIEEPAVFEAVHATPLRWLAEGRIDGLRIDHVDGMSDPQAYCRRLRQRCAEVLVEAGRPMQQPYVVVEKILADDEPWSPDWAADGETGYRFANQANGLFVDGEHAQAFDAIAAQAGALIDFDAELDAAKRSIMSASLAAELHLLTELARGIALADRHTRDLTRAGLRAAIVEIAAAFDVYRSYVSEQGPAASDRARIERAAALARERCLPSQTAHVEFVRALMLHGHEEPRLEARERKLRFVQRLQQFTAPVMAKSMEDTAFYRYHRLVALNDVGGDPRHFGTSVGAFHAANLARRDQTPHTLLAGSTHDSKRSEDLRARLDLLSEMPERWAETLARWRALAEAQWRIGSLPAELEPGDALLLWQTLVGIWPATLQTQEELDGLRERVLAYMQKAVREGKQRSSWLETDAAYEQTLQRAIEILLARIEPNPLLGDLRRFVDEIAPFGLGNSIALAALKLSSPGVPDIYQGNEGISLALVDPDNRQPVDFQRLESRLDELEALVAAATQANEAPHADPAALADLAGALQRRPLGDGLHKTFVIWRLLQWRADHAALLREGSYEPLEPTGPQAAHLVAYARRGPGGACIVLVPRLLWSLTGGDIAALLDARCWGETALQMPPWALGLRWREVVAGRPVADYGEASQGSAGSGRWWPIAPLLRAGLPAVLHADLPPQSGDRELDTA
jgi:(1->4)-alpha-D-glucan 1-alpha-D-glucosylmutase